jgi:serine protease Do
MSLAAETSRFREVFIMRSYWRHLFRHVLVTVLIGAVAVLAVGSASGQDARTPMQKATQLASPSVVLIETRANVKVAINDTIESTFFEFRKRGTRRLNTAAGIGSGFIVDGNGTIVTASHVVDPDPPTMRQIITDVLFSREHDLADALLAEGDPQRARDLAAGVKAAETRCLREETCRFTIIPVVSVHAGFALGPEKLLTDDPATIERRTSFAKTDVAVLTVQGQSLPTIPLAESAEHLSGGDEVVALGFPESALRNVEDLAEPTPKFGEVDRVVTQGTAKQIRATLGVEKGMSGGPLVDSTGRVVGLTSFLIRQSSGEAGTKVFRAVEDIRQALRQAGATTNRGLVDTKFAEGMDLYWKDYFTDAQPALRTVIDLQQGHVQAKAAMTTAVQKAGTGEDKSPSLKDEGFPWWGFVLIALGALLVLGGAAFALWKSGRLTRRPAARPEEGRAAAPAAGRTVLSPRPGEPTLVVKDGPGAGQRFAIKTDMMLGREEADINLDDAEVSRRHAMIRRVNGKLELSDLRSANGTRINGSRVEGTQPLSDGDTIEVGGTTLAVEMPSERGSKRDGGTATSRRPEGR